jgi:predicted alpha/beta hydrolase family esterase
VRGAFRGAPAQSASPKDARCFGPIPQGSLPMPSVVVASQKDPYGSIGFAGAVWHRCAAHAP